MQLGDIMLSKVELEYLKSPEKFDKAYGRVIRHRIKVKQAQMRQQSTVLDDSSATVTEFCNAADLGQYQISAIQAPTVKLRWAEPDLNRRPLARKANVLTRLDDRPPHFACVQPNLSCLD